MKTITDREITQYVKTMKFASNGRYKIRAFCKKADGTRIYGSFGSPIEVKVPTEAPRINYISAEYRKALVINWNRPKGAEGYIIERGVSGTGAFKTVATIKNPSTLTYKDKNLKPGQRYYYKITAIRKTADGKISKSKPSPVKNWKCV